MALSHLRGNNKPLTCENINGGDDDTTDWQHCSAFSSLPEQSGFVLESMMQYHVAATVQHQWHKQNIFCPEQLQKTSLSEHACKEGEIEPSGESWRRVTPFVSLDDKKPNNS